MPVGADEAGMTAVVSVWRHRDFRLAWFAGLVNNAGDWALLIALPVYVFSETGSGSTTALLVVFQVLVSAALSPFSGGLVDRLDLRRCLVGTNVLQVLALGPLLVVTPGRVWPAYIVVALQAALTTVNDPANIAIVPRLVKPQQLTQANAALSASLSVARLVGAPLGGVVVAFGGLNAVVIADAVSFAMSAVAVAAIRTATDPIPQSEVDLAEHGLGVRSGFRAVRRNPTLRVQLPIFALGQIAQGGFLLLFVVFVVDVLGHDAKAVGTIRGVMAIGAMLGAALIGRFGRDTDPTRLVAVGYVGMGTASLVFWNASYVTHAVWIMCVLFSLSGIPGSALAVGQNTTMQRATPPAVLGRVAGIWLMSDAVGTAIGSAFAGILVDRASVVVLLNFQAGIYLLAGVLSVLLLRMPNLKAG